MEPEEVGKNYFRATEIANVPAEIQELPTGRLSTNHNDTMIGCDKLRKRHRLARILLEPPDAVCESGKRN